MIYQIYINNLIVGTFANKRQMKKAFEHLTDYVDGTPLIDCIGWREHKIDNSADSAVTNFRQFKQDEKHFKKLNQSFK